MNKNKKSVRNNYINKMQNINRMDDYEQINPEKKNMINKAIQNNTNKNSNSTNNNEFIRDLIAFSKIGKKRTNQKDYNNQVNNTSKFQNKRLNELNQNNLYNEYYNNKIIYKSSEISPNKKYFDKMNSNIQNQNINYIPQNKSNYPKYHLSKINNNNNGINHKFGITERNSPNKNSKERILRKNNTLSKFFTSIQKNEKQIDINKSLLNVAVSQVMESPLFGQIKEPKEGHSKGIIQLIKYSKNSPDYKKEKDIFDNENLKFENNINNKKVLYLHDKKMFDEPINNNNYKQNIKYNNNGYAFYIHNKALSFNNNLNTNEALLTLNESLSNINLNDKKGKIEDNSSNDNKYDINQGLYNNNIKNKKLHNKMNSEQMLIIKNNSLDKKPKDNLKKNIAILNRIRKQKQLELNSYNTNNQEHSPKIVNQVVNYRNEYHSNSYKYLDEDNIDNLNIYKLNSNSYLSNESINKKDIYNTKNYHSKDKYENINNIKKSYFYNTNDKINSKEPSKKIELLKTETNFAKFNKFKKQRFLNNNNITINKTNIQNTENSNLLYFKPKKNQINKYLSYYRNKTENNSLMNTNDLSDVHNVRKNKNNEIIFEDHENLLSNSIKKNSPSKSPSQIYRKPIHKNNFLEISKTSNTINNNFIIYKDEINFINKSKEYNINNENLNINLNIIGSNFSIKQKVLNKKANFITKYYQYHIIRPKIATNLFTKEYYKYNIQTKIPIPYICIFTKENIIKFKKNKIKNINIKTNNELYSAKNDFNNINKNKNILINNNINNDIIYLLNIITSKNILNVENQLTKLIIISKNAFNINGNLQNAILYINDIINNINIFISILINKAIKENKYIELYIKLCNDLSNKYLNSINEFIIKKYLDENINNNKYNIILSFKNILNQECIKKCENLLINNNEEIKEQLLNLLNFVFLSFENNISNKDTFMTIIKNIINEYNNIENIDSKYYLIYLIINFILKLNKNNFDDDNNNIIEEIYNKINDINKDEVPKYLNKVIEKFLTAFYSNKLNINNNSSDNEQDISCDKLIKEDFDDYINFIKNTKDDKDKSDFKIIKNLKIFEIENIIKDIINIFIEIVTKEEELLYYKKYINNIFKPIFSKIPINKLRIFHKNFLLILSDINQLCKSNIYSFEIIGYLIYLLIENELCDIQDMNIFMNKNEETKINICKIIKYIILSSESNSENYSENFKNIDLFKNNSLFDEYIKDGINPIK